MKVGEILREGADLFEQRDAVYGSAYKSLGDLLKVLFPYGITLESAEEMGRFGLLMEVCSKLQRYSKNFKNGGHRDSMIDISVYCAMIQEIDDEACKK